MNDEYKFFWNGPFSQWSSSKFTFEGVSFNCAEQAMMYHKALTFEDSEIAEQVLQARTPKAQKALGRKVSNFNESTWDDVKFDLIVNINIAKFQQSKTHYKDLQATGDKLMVEASPYDKIWGIGMRENEAKNTSPENWKGENLLGKALDVVKIKLGMV
jgi:ribA/ribD-fused uncharacterized protein